MSDDVSSPVKAPLPDVSIGIASAATPNQACVCALSAADRSLRFHTVSSTGRAQRQDALDTGRLDVIHETELDALAGLVACGGQRAAATILAAADRILPHPDFGHTPAGVFTWTSATLGTLIALPSLGVPMACGCYEVPAREAMLVHHVEPRDGLDDHLERPKMLSNGVLTACARLVLGAEPTPRQSAAVAALLARAPGAYYYWSSFHQPPSLGDVIAHRRGRQSRLRVLAGSESFSMYVGGGDASTDAVALAYGLAAQAHEALGPADAHKAALLSLCEEFGFSMTCYSTRPDAGRVDPRRVWPWPQEDDWAIQAIRAL